MVRAMAFTCTLPNLEIESSGETLTFPIGFDEVCSYSVVMGFVLLDKPEHREFYFSVYQYNHVTDTTIPFSSGRLTKIFIPDKEHRTLILGAVCEAIPTLLELVRPEWPR